MTFFMMLMNPNKINNKKQKIQKNPKKDTNPQVYKKKN